MVRSSIMRALLRNYLRMHSALPYPLIFLGALLGLLCAPRADAQAPKATAANPCDRPAIGSVVHEPEDLRSQNGVLRVDLTYRSFTPANGSTEYCYVYKDGSLSPTLRLKPNDTLILGLKNEVNLPQSPDSQTPATNPGTMHMDLQPDGSCTRSKMTAASTNLHFHGLTVPPVCHEDDVLRTLIQPGDPPFEYRFQIPPNEPPGLYWYHPHVHGFSKAQVLGGASGALIVEGIERANRLLAGLPERVFVIRDQDLLNPDAQPAAGGPSLPPVVLDHDGDAVNTGTGTGKPAKDLSINFVPVPFPDYPPAIIEMKPGERQLWRVVNSCAITYLNLQVLVNDVPQQLGVVAIDGVPINQGLLTGDRAIWQNHLGLAPGARVEFIFKGPPHGAQTRLVTRSVNTGWGGENDPNRPLATIVAKADAVEPRSALATSPAPLATAKPAWVGNVTPVRVRKLYFSETSQDPNDPNSPTTYYVTVDGQTPKAFDSNSNVPDIVAHQGDVEDWIIENRTREVHAFHIHQIHFLLLSWFGIPVDESFLRDTIDVPFWDGHTPVYPSVKVRMDFRDPNSIGTFVYHCHLLEHEDGGMMGLIRVDPADRARRSAQLIKPSGQKNNTQLKLCGLSKETAPAIFSQR
jgi:FtsP/CotA-like multicopper oxidase with cupredoxin domain